jgi:hypothetical protein
VRSALSAFKASLSRVNGIASHVDSEVVLAAGNAVVRERHETLLCGAVVISTGYFESFIHDLVRAFIKGVCALGRPFATLPARLQKTHYVNGAALLHRFVTNKAPWITDTQVQLIERLDSVRAALPYELFWEAFAATNSNPGPRTVEDILQRCAITNPWGQVSVNSPSKRSKTILETGLASLIGLRNECAHTGKAARIPTTTELRGHVDLLTEIGEGMTVTLETRLSTL